MEYEAKFTEVKQAREVKSEVTCSLIYVKTLSMSVLCLAARVDRKKIGVLDFYNFIKESLFIKIEFFSPKFIV